VFVSATALASSVAALTMANEHATDTEATQGLVIVH